MITEKESIIIKQFFGPGFAKRIANKLNEKNKKRSPVGHYSVSAVLNKPERRRSKLADDIRALWAEEVENQEKTGSNLIKRSKALMS